RGVNGLPIGAFSYPFLKNLIYNSPHMALKALLRLHLPKKGMQKCCCCKRVVEKDDIELWLIPEMVLRETDQADVFDWERTGSQELHTLCSYCAHRMDGQLRKPVNRIL